MKAESIAETLGEPGASDDGGEVTEEHGAAPQACPTEITRFIKSGGPLTKHIWLTADGSINSDGSACTMSRGGAHRVTLNGVDALASLIGSLGSDEAIALGALRGGLPFEVQVVTKDKLNGLKPPAIARTTTDLTYRP